MRDVILIFFSDAYVVGTHLNCLNFIKKLRKYTDYNLKTTKLLDSVFIGVCAVIRSNAACLCCFIGSDSVKFSCKHVIHWIKQEINFGNIFKATYCKLELPQEGLQKLCYLYRLSTGFVNYSITKTYLYDFYPLKPHFYIVKLEFTGVYIIFLISAQQAVLKSTHNLCFEQKYEKYQNFLSENFHFLVIKFSVYLNRCVFVMFNLLDLRGLDPFSEETWCTVKQLRNHNSCLLCDRSGWKWLKVSFRIVADDMLNITFFYFSLQKVEIAAGKILKYFFIQPRKKLHILCEILAYFYK